MTQIALGQKARIVGKFESEWRGVVVTVAGISLRNVGIDPSDPENIDITVWEGEGIGMTDGFYPRELEIISE